MKLLIFLTIFGVALSTSNSNMNGDYLISNPNMLVPEKFSTDYSTYDKEIKFFDVYSPPV